MTKLYEERQQMFMKKIAVLYWSGTGNTEAMAHAVAEGIRSQGAEAELMTPELFRPSAVDSFSAFAFGCPSMGVEQLEEQEFQPMWDTLEPLLRGKRAVLFGSYGWGDGEWMRNWEECCASAEIALAQESVICCEAPDEDTLARCRALGAAIAL